MLTAILMTAIQPQPILAGYLPAWKFDVLNTTQLQPLTDVIYFSIQPNADGTLNLKDINPDHLQALAKLKSEHNFRLLICIGGWERSEHFPTVTANPTLRTAFINNLKTFANKHNLDGVDLDWEHPKDKKESNNYALLITELKASIKPKLVTAALAGWQTLPKEGWDNLDRLHLMSYDHAGKHATIQSSKEDLQKVTAQGIPSSKIALGVPFYARSIENRDAIAYGQLLPKLMNDTKSDEVDGYYFNNIATITEKAKLAKKQKLAGIMIWEITQDTNGPRSLTLALKEVFGK